MDSLVKLYLERAENELQLARVIFEVTSNKKLQRDVFHLDRDFSFFSGVIAHSYYAIFYSAKAYLLSKGIKVRAPNEHKKAFEAFKKLVNNGVVDAELLKLDETMVVRAGALLGLFKIEKRKRGRFTYQRLSQANKEPAEESMGNSTTFFKHMFGLVQSSQRQAKR